MVVGVLDVILICGNILIVFMAHINASLVELKDCQNTSSVVNCVVGDGGSVDKGSWSEATLNARWLWISFLSF